VPDRWPRESAEAILADFTLPQEHCLRAQKAEVVQRLHDRNSSPVRSRIQRRRDQRERVMGVDYIRLEGRNLARQISEGACRPNRLGSRRNAPDPCELVVVAGEKLNLLTTPSQEFNLGIDHRIFTATMLVGIVRNQHSQMRSIGKTWRHGARSSDESEALMKPAAAAS
jgi:hypothetical protein